MGLLFIPDNFIIVVQEIGGTLAVQRFVLPGEHHQAAIAILLTEVGHTLGGDVSILFRAVDFAFHVFMRKQVWIEHRLADIAQKTNPLRPVAAKADATDQRPVIGGKLQHFIDLFQQMLHIVLGVARAVANQPHVRVDKLQLHHLLMVTGAVRVKTV